MRKVEVGGAIWGQVKRERKEQDKQMCVGMFWENVLVETAQGFLPERPGGLAWVRNGLQPGLGLRSTRGPCPRGACAQVLLQTQGPGSAGRPPPDSLLEAVRGREHPAAVEQACSAVVGAP